MARTNAVTQESLEKEKSDPEDDWIRNSANTRNMMLSQIDEERVNSKQDR